MLIKRYNTNPTVMYHFNKTEKKPFTALSEKEERRVLGISPFTQHIRQKEADSPP
jgi:hypothetical protein